MSVPASCKSWHTSAKSGSSKSESALAQEGKFFDFDLVTVLYTVVFRLLALSERLVVLWGSSKSRFALILLDAILFDLSSSNSLMKFSGEMRLTALPP